MKAISNKISNRYQSIWMITNVIFLTLAVSAVTKAGAEEQSLGTGGMTATVTGNTRDGVTGGSTGVAVQGSGLSTGGTYYIEGRAEGRAAIEFHAEDGLRRTLTGQSLSGGLEARGQAGAMTAERGLSFCPGAQGEVRVAGATSLQGGDESIANGRLVAQIGPGLCYLSRGSDKIFVRFGTHAGVQDNGTPEITPEALAATLGTSVIVRKDDWRAEGVVRYLPATGANQFEIVLDAKVSDRLAVGARGGIEGIDLNPNGPGPREAPVFTTTGTLSVAF